MSRSSQDSLSQAAVPDEGLLLSAENFTVERKHRYEQEEVCLREVSLELARGDFLVLAGEQGSGVSMFSRWIAAGMVRGATKLSGEINLDGMPLFSLNRRRRHQWCRSRALYAGRNSFATFEEGRTVMQNLRDFVAGRNLSLQKLASGSLHEQLYRVGCMEPERLLETRARDCPPLDIARLLLVRVLLADVDFLICDGVTFEFDVVTERQFLEMLVHFQKEEKLTILFTSGKLRGVESFADHVAIFYEGGVLEQGEASTLISNPKFDYTREFLQCSPTLLDLPKKLEGISREAIAEAEKTIRGSASSIES